MRTRMVITVLALYGLTLPVFADEKPKPVTEKEALAEVDAVLALLAKKAPKPTDDPSAWRLRCASFSRATFGQAYADLPAGAKPAVDAYAHLVLGGTLAKAAEALAFFDEKPVLTTEAAAGGVRNVRCRFKHPLGPGPEFLYGVARKADGGVEIVDVGSKGLLVGVMLRAAWRAAVARKPEDKTPSQTLLLFVSVLTKKTQEKARLVKAKDNLRTLLTLLLTHRMEDISTGWAPYGGKSFVLAVVAHGLLDPAKAGERSVLFSPTAPASIRAAAAAYKEVTVAALKEGRDWSKKMLTTHAGRRNDEAKYKITTDDERRGAIILADLSFDDVVVAAYTDGSVKVLSRKDLGLGPDDPFVVGDKAKSEELRKLSLR